MLVKIENDNNNNNNEKLNKIYLFLFSPFVARNSIKGLINVV